MSLSIRQNSGKIIFAAALLAAVITFLSYIPALDNGFINWDDTSYYHTEEIRRLDLNFLKWAFSSVSSNWHPLTVISHGLGYAAWGLNPFGHHLVNVILHSINTFLVALLAYKLIRIRLEDGQHAVFAALITALLFGIHPVHVESVAWISERKDVLGTLFFLLSISSYLSYAAGRRSGYVFSVCFLILSLLSKPMAVSMPFVLLILDYYPLQRVRSLGLGRIIAEKAPFIVPGILVSLLTIWAQSKVGAFQMFEATPLSVRSLVAVRAYIFYLYKMVLPIDLAPYYPYPSGVSILSFEYLGYVFLFSAISIVCALSLRKTGLFAAAWLYYAVTLFPMIGIIQVGGQAAADRYTYLPGLAPFLLTGLGAGYLLKGRLRLITGALTVFVMALLIVLTVRQISVWEDSVRFWSYELGLYGDKLPIAYVNRGIAHEDSGSLDEALKDYSRAIELRPQRSDTYINRGLVYGKKGERLRAIEDFTRAIELNPSDALAYNNRGLAYRQTGDFAQALKDFEAALKINPGLGAVYHNMSIVYSEAGEFEAAFEADRKASELGYR